MNHIPITYEDAIASGWIVARENYNGRHQLALYKRFCQREGRPLVTVTPGRKFATVAAFWRGLTVSSAWLAAVADAVEELDAYGHTVTPEEAIIGPRRVPIEEAFTIAARLGAAVMHETEIQPIAA